MKIEIKQAKSEEQLVKYGNKLFTKEQIEEIKNER